MRRALTHRIEKALFRLAARQKARLAVCAAAGLLLWAGPARAASSEDATITVTPVADVSLSLSAPSYAFGPIDVNSSTNSATAVTLTNNGQVSVVVSKQIFDQSNPVGWTAAASAGLDTYVLYAATSAVRLELAEFTAATKFGAQGAGSPLTGPTGIQPVLPPTGDGQSLDLWFRLDMPTAVSAQTGRSISIRFSGTAQ